ncbi:MAG TPA: hypothetical protein VHS99_26170 [Chloroflexota bacterium]|nr:hypothetical protein [Chloroflexota bacterium]
MPDTAAQACSEDVQARLHALSCGLHRPAQSPVSLPKIEDDLNVLDADLTASAAVLPAGQRGASPARRSAVGKPSPIEGRRMIRGHEV